LHLHVVDLNGDFDCYGGAYFSGIGSGLMYELRGLDGDVRLVLPSTSSFSGHGIFEDLDALDYAPIATP
jgi:hypothetical protein